MHREVIKCDWTDKKHQCSLFQTLYKSCKNKNQSDSFNSVPTERDRISWIMTAEVYDVYEDM